MKTIIIGDLHLQSKSQLRRREFDALVGYLRSICDPPSSRLAILGDLFNSSSAISWDDYLKLIDFLLPWKEVIIVIGNHDCPFKSTEPCKPLQGLFTYPNVKRVADSFSVWHYYSEKPEGSSSLLLAHKDVKELNQFYDKDWAVSLKDFSSYRVVFLGHLHFTATKGNVVVVGPPYPTSFGDQTAGTVVVLDGTKVSLLTPKITAYTKDPTKVEQLLEEYHFVVTTEYPGFDSDRVFVKSSSTSSLPGGSSCSSSHILEIPTVHSVLESFRDNLGKRKTVIFRSLYEQATSSIQ